MTSAIHFGKIMIKKTPSYYYTLFTYCLILLATTSTSAEPPAEPYVYEPAVIKSLQKLIVQEEDAKAKEILMRDRPNGGWCTPAISGENARLRPTFFADLAVLAYRVGELDEASLCLGVASKASGSKKQAAVFFQASQLVTKMTDDQLRRMKNVFEFFSDNPEYCALSDFQKWTQIMHEGGEAVVVKTSGELARKQEPLKIYEKRDVDLSNRHSSVADRVHQILPEPTEKLDAQVRAQVKQSLLLAAAYEAPREAYLKRLSASERRKVLANIRFPEVRRFESLPTPDAAEFMFQSSFQEYPLKKKGGERPKNLKAMTRAWKRIGSDDEGILSYEVETVARSKWENSPTVRVSRTCAGSYHGAYLIDDASRIFITIATLDKGFGLDLGRSSHCAELHQSGELMVALDVPNLISVTAENTSWSARGDFTIKVLQALCDVSNTTNARCLTTTEVIKETTTEDDSYIVTYSALPQLSMKNGKVQFVRRPKGICRVECSDSVGYRPDRDDFTFPEYEALDGMPLNEAMDALPGIEETIRDRIMSLK